MNRQNGAPGPLEVDGSFGEGGGQILRTALYLSVALGTPIHVTKIRAGRRIPGLRPQHSATIKILGEISSAKVEGGEVGSTELRFTPGKVGSASGTFDLGTAASIPLVLQAVIPAVSLAGASYDLELVGGTDVPWSPTSDYLEKVIAPAMLELGIRFSFKVSKRGYYPNGGGKASAHIEPCDGVRSIAMGTRRSAAGSFRTVDLVSRCGKLPVSVAERQAKAAISLLRGRGVEVATKQVSHEDPVSPGSSILVSLVGEGCYVGGDAIGAREKPAESVGRDAAADFLTALSSGARVDSHLADMLVPVLCLADSPSSLLIPFVSEHLVTSLHVAGEFTGASHKIEKGSGAALLSISPPPAQ